MRSWTPKSRNYWGQKKRNDSSDSDPEESNLNNDRPPMPWEPQDTTEYDKLYWEGEDSDEIDLDNETVIPTIEIIENRPKPKKSQSLIELIKGKAPEDIDPQNFLEKIIRGMIKGKGIDSIPKVIANNAIMGPEDYKVSQNFNRKEKYFGEGLVSQLPNKLSHQNKVWPSGYIYPIPDSFKIYKSQDFSASHYGIDIVGKTSGEILDQQVLAVCDGWIDKVVVANDLIEGGGNDNNRGGIRVRIIDSIGLYYLYYHLAPDSNNHLKLGQKINQGELIGKVGSSGQGNFDNRANGTGIHLHFEMWSGFDNKGRPINIDFSNHFPELNEIPYQ